MFADPRTDLKEEMKIQNDDNTIDITSLSFFPFFSYIIRLIWFCVIFTLSSIATSFALEIFPYFFPPSPRIVNIFALGRDWKLIGSIIFLLTFSFLFSFCSSLCNKNNKLRRLDVKLLHKLSL